MNKIESAIEIEETGNYLQLFLNRAPKKKNHDFDAVAGHNSKIILSLNDYADLVNKLILLNLLGAPLTMESMDLLHHILLQSVHGISDPTRNNRLC